GKAVLRDLVARASFARLVAEVRRLLDGHPEVAGDDHHADLVEGAIQLGNGFGLLSTIHAGLLKITPIHVDRSRLRRRMGGCPTPSSEGHDRQGADKLRLPVPADPVKEGPMTILSPSWLEIKTGRARSPTVADGTRGGRVPRARRRT